MNSLSSPRIYGNNIEGGDGINFTNGIRNIESSSPLIFNNTIKHGKGDDASSIKNGNDSSPVIQNNTIMGEDSVADSYGILNIDSSTSVIQNNIIGAGLGDLSTGIYNNTASSIMQNNTISGGTGGTASVGIFNVTVSSTYVMSNIIFTSGGGIRLGICEGDAVSEPLSVINNDIFNNNLGGTFYHYYDVDSACGGSTNCNLSQLNSFSDMISYGNISVNNSSGQLFVDSDGVDNNITTIEDNNWNLLDTATELLNSGLVCPDDYYAEFHIWGSGANQDDCDEKYPYANSNYNSGNCRTIFLFGASEIINDSIGNDNGLCEDGEDCLYNPNMGAYAGHGDLVHSGCDISGVIEGITIMKYMINGH